MSASIFLLAATISLVIGLVLGMLGGGGAILTLPMLVYILGVEPRSAIATSLLVVGVTSVFATVVHARRRAVRWKVGLVFGAAAMAGAFAGGRLAQLVATRSLLIVFGIVMITSAIAMLRPPKAERELAGVGLQSSSSPPQQQPRQLGALVRVLLLGASVGVLSGLVGAGGGFLIVPALALFGGFTMRDAIGTSLFIITLQSFAGFAGQVSTGIAIDTTLALVVAIAAASGSTIGALVGRKVSTKHLRNAFAWLVLAMGLFVVCKQLSSGLTIAIGLLSLVMTFIVTRRGARAPGADAVTTTRS